MSRYRYGTAVPTPQKPPLWIKVLGFLFFLIVGLGMVAFALSLLVLIVFLVGFLV